MKANLPSHANLEYYRKEAKERLRAARKEGETAATYMKLSDAQHAVARENGFANWTELKAAVLDASASGGKIDSVGRQHTHEASTKQPKQRYKSDANVQRWLKTRDKGKDEGFASSFLEGHRDRDWIISSLAAFHAKGYITDVVGVVKSGKEATVYRCEGQQDGKQLAVKIYRPRMFRSLQNDATYRENRTAGKDRRSQKAMDQMSRRGRAFRMESWIHFEFDTLKQLFCAGVAVPEPIDCHGNAILMEYIGDECEPAPMLQHADLDHARAEILCKGLVRDVELMLACDRVHGDLSAFNVLYWHERAIIIDFAQAVDARSGPDVFGLLSRDVGNLARFFSKFGVSVDPEYLAFDMWSRYLQGPVEISAAYTSDER